MGVGEETVDIDGGVHTREDVEEVVALRGEKVLVGGTEIEIAESNDPLSGVVGDAVDGRGWAGAVSSRRRRVF
ncbi:MAG TPA: hypothetical protein VK638_52070 [Edaphobacter sp.]|nr:hypothetical protein [Edaphobacter sp.]